MQLIKSFKNVNAMMPVDFEEANITLGPPRGSSREEVFELRACKGHAPDGIPCFVTCWKPSLEDLEALNSGRPLIIQNLGEVFFPMAVWTTDEDLKPNI